MADYNIPKFGDTCPYCHRPGLQNLDDTTHAECRRKIHEKEQTERCNVPVTRGEILEIFRELDYIFHDCYGMGGIQSNVVTKLAKKWKIDIED